MDKEFISVPLDIITIRDVIDGITIELSRGEIPDRFRTSRFGPITEFELPDTKGTDEEFNEFIDSYRRQTD